MIIRKDVAVHSVKGQSRFSAEYFRIQVSRLFVFLLLVSMLQVSSMQAEAAETAGTIETAEVAETAGTIETAEAVETAEVAETAGTMEAAEAAKTAGTMEAAEAVEAAEAAETAGTMEGLETASEAEGTIRVHLAGMPGEPDPATVMDADTASLLKQISEGLTVLDRNGEAAPGAAQSWEVSGDGLVWTFTLQEDLCWSDGEPMEASDFAALFQQTADPASEVLYGRQLTRNIAGYDELLHAEDDTLDVYAEDSRTLVVHLSTPDPDFARKCASWALLPIRERIREQDGGTEEEKTESRIEATLTWEDVTGNGPYVITSQEEGNAFFLKKNLYYHEGDRVPFETVLWMVSGDENEEYSDFLNGEIDAVSEIPKEEEADFFTSAYDNTAELSSLSASPDDAGGFTRPAGAAAANDPADKTSAAANDPADKTAAATNGIADKTAAAGDVDPEPSDNFVDAASFYTQAVVPDTLGIRFNCRQEALSDPDVRRALSMAVDRTYIASEILNNHYAPASDWYQTQWYRAPVKADAAGFLQLQHFTVSPETALFEDQAAQPLFRRLVSDTEEAKKLLASAGYPDGKGFPALTCLANQEDASYLIAEYLVFVWQDLGIDVRVETEDPKDIAREKAAGTFDIICESITLASDLPAEELAGFVTDSADNVCGFSSEAYDRLLDTAKSEYRGRGEKSLRRYTSNMKEAMEILTEEVPCAPLAMRRRSWLRQEGCSGLFCDASGCWQVWRRAAWEVSSKNAFAKSSYTKSEEYRQYDILYSGACAASVSGACDRIGETRSGLSLHTCEASVDALASDMAGKSAQEAVSAFFSGDSENAAGGGSDNSLARLRAADTYFEKADTSAWLTRQAWLLDSVGEGAQRLVSLPKYTEVHLTGTGNARYARIDVDGRFHYLPADRVTADESVLRQIREEEEARRLQEEMITASLSEVKQSGLADSAADIHAETDRILAEIAHHEMIKTQTRNPNWNGPVLSRSRGSVTGPSGKETYYNLNMSGVVNIMRRMGNTDEYWVRDDGCKMLGDYIMCAANLRVHPRGTLVECSLGTCIVCDTGGFASRNAYQLDIAVTW